MWHIWGRGEVHTGLWCGILREGEHLDNLGIDGRIILKRILNLVNTLMNLRIP
jgi:hypothetical protein